MSVPRTVLLLFYLSVTAGAVAQSSSPAGSWFERVHRPGAVIVQDVYDTSNLTIPLEEIHELLPRDAIPALVNPRLVDASAADWISPDFRVIAVVVGETAVAIPLRILNYHEIANLVVEGEPIAVTYCPLCDSASVFSRKFVRIEDGQEETEVLEFGVTGALYNSNVLFYDRTHLGLWSQLAMKAVSGPYAGTTLEHQWITIVDFKEFQDRHPGGLVVSKDTGYPVDYTKASYEGYMASDRLIVPVRNFRQRLPKKTLGVGVLDGSESWFVPARKIKGPFVLEVASGEVQLAPSSAGVRVVSAPEGVQVAQAFYYAWTAFHPNATIVSRSARR